MIDTDETLLDRMKSLPADEAWAEFHTAYAPPLGRILRAEGMTDKEADEVVQETMTELLKLMPTFVYDPNRRFRSLLITIARRAAARRRRASARRLHREDSYAKDVEALFILDPSQDLLDERAWRQAILAEAAERYARLAKFNAKEQKVFDAYVLQGRPAAEVARETGMSEAAIYTFKTRHFRGFKTIVTRLLQEITDS